MSDRSTENTREMSLEANWGSIMGTSVGIYDPDPEPNRRGLDQRADHPVRNPENGSLRINQPGSDPSRQNEDPNQRDVDPDLENLADCMQRLEHGHTRTDSHRRQRRPPRRRHRCVCGLSCNHGMVMKERHEMLWEMDQEIAKKEFERLHMIYRENGRIAVEKDLSGKDLYWINRPDSPLLCRPDSNIVDI